MYSVWLFCFAAFNVCTPYNFKHTEPVLTPPIQFGSVKDLLTRSKIYDKIDQQFLRKFQVTQDYLPIENLQAYLEHLQYTAQYGTRKQTISRTKIDVITSIANRPALDINSLNRRARVKFRTRLKRFAILISSYGRLNL